MSDEAGFSLKLIDDSSGPARRAEKNFDRASEAVRRTQKSVDDLNRTRMTGVGGKHVSSQFRAMDVGARRANSSLVGLDKTAGSATKGMDGAAGSGLGLGKVLGGAVLIGGAFAAARAIQRLTSSVVSGAVEWAGFGQDMRFAFGALDQGVPGQQHFDKASELARRYGLDLKETQNQYRDLLSAELDTSTVERLVGLGADLRAIGEGASVQPLAKAIEQVQARGSLDSRTLRQFQSMGVFGEHIERAIADAMGVESANLEDAMKDGGIAAAEAIPIIERAIMNKLGTSRVGELGERYADETFRGIMGRSRAVVGSQIAQITARIEGPLMKLAGRYLDRLTGFLDSERGSQAIERFGDLLERTITVGIRIGEVFGEGLFAGLSDVEDGVGNTIENLLDHFEDPEVLASIRQFGQDIGSIARGIVSLGEAVSRHWGTISKIADIAMWLNPATVGFKGVVEGYRALRGGNEKEDVVPANDNGREIGEALGDGYVAGIRGRRSAAREEGRLLARGASDGMRSELEISSPSKLTHRFGGWTGEGFERGLESSLPSIRDAANDIAAAPLQSLQTAAGQVSRVGAGAATSSNQTTVDVGGMSNVIQLPPGATEGDGKVAREIFRQEITKFFQGLDMTGT
jgi:hypothetical protein